MFTLENSGKKFLCEMVISDRLNLLQNKNVI